MLVDCKFVFRSHGPFLMDCSSSEDSIKNRSFYREHLLYSPFFFLLLNVSIKPVYPIISKHLNNQLFHVVYRLYLVPGDRRSSCEYIEEPIPDSRKRWSSSLAVWLGGCQHVTAKEIMYVTKYYTKPRNCEGSCEHGNEPSGSVKSGGLLD
jgi:hypothetical protein